MTPSQCARLGYYETYELTDNVANKLIAQMRRLPEFEKFPSYERSGNYLICRRTHQLPKAAREHINSDSFDTVFKNRYGLGDVRIKFEVVVCPRATVIGQQLQLKDQSTDRFTFQRW